MDKPSTSPSPSPAPRRTATLLGVALFALIIVWGLWHAIIGPRVIDPLPGDPSVTAPPPDPTRAPPTE